MKVLRRRLGAALVEVAANLQVAGKQRRKQDLLQLLNALHSLQEASRLHSALTCAHRSHVPCSSWGAGQSAAPWVWP